MAEKPPQRTETAPDPEEDDLDDLDDVLDSFQATSVSDSKKDAPAPTASGPGRPANTASASNAPAPGGESEEDFAKQLQAGMTSLMSELDSNPEMQAEFEKMMADLIAAGAAPSDKEAGEHLAKAAEVPQKLEEFASPPAAAAGASGTASASTGGASSKKSMPQFSDTIQKTMERMQASNTTATAATSTPAGGQSEDDILAQMMRELTEGGEGGEGDFNSMLMSMMAHLTNKEILYDPMKELHDKFPEWMEKNKGTTNADELKRYEEQQKLVGEIVGRFERSGYSDDNEEDREYIVERMQKMQAAGSPPADLVGDMSAAQEALGDLDGGCPTQ